MKKSILLFGTVALIMFVTSCKKEVIEIVATEEISTSNDFSERTLSSDNSNTDQYGSVTDPDDDEDFDSPKKKIDGPGK